MGKGILEGWLWILESYNQVFFLILKIKVFLEHVVLLYNEKHFYQISHIYITNCF